MPKYRGDGVFHGLWLPLRLFALTLVLLETRGPDLLLCQLRLCCSNLPLFNTIDAHFDTNSCHQRLHTLDITPNLSQQSYEGNEKQNGRTSEEIRFILGTAETQKTNNQKRPRNTLIQ